MNRPPNSGQDQTIQRELIFEARRQHTARQYGLAEATLKKALATNPHETQALLLLGVVESETGRHQIATEHFIKAVNLEPNNPIGHALLGKCFAKQGFHLEAIQQFQQALSLNPNGYEAMYALAESMIAARLERQAVRVLRQAVSKAPDLQGFLLLADLERESGRIEDAEKYCRMAIDSAPDLASGHVLMGRILTEQTRFDEAGIHWKRAEELNVEAGSIHLTKAFSLGTIGQFDATLKELERSIAANPNQGIAYKAIAYSKRITSSDLPLVHQMEALLLNDAVATEEQVHLLYALGKSYDNLGDFERAIDFFDQANALRDQLRTEPPFNWAVISSVIDASKKLFTHKDLQRWRHAGIESSVPILVVGMIRSGTTLIEQMLTCHPKVGGAGEQYYWGENEPGFIDHRGLRVHPARLSACAREYLEVLTTVAPGYEHVIDKNPSNFMLLGSMHLAFPNMRIIHIRRNPIDTALSIWTTPMNSRAPFASSRESIVFAYKEYLRIMNHWREVLPPDRLLDVQYEDLVAEPESHGRRMLEFCGLEWDEACLHPEANRRRIKTPSFWQARQPIYKSSTSRWKQYEPWLGAFEELREVR